MKIYDDNRPKSGGVVSIGQTDYTLFKPVGAFPLAR